MSALTPIVMSFGLISLAEIGDKSQIVCMALAARHKPLPVFMGAIAAFTLLNTLAVSIGASLGHWLPTELITIIAAVMFALFGIQALRASDEEEDCEISAVKCARHVFVTTFVMIFVAELGDKTQMAIAGLSANQSSDGSWVGVWIGATLALIATSAMGVFAGKRWLSQLNPRLLNKASGALFLAFAAIAIIKLLVG